MISRYIAWVLLVANIALWSLALVFDSPPYTDASDRVWAFSFLAVASVGMVLALKVPRNPFGWLILVAPGLIGAGVATMEAGSEGTGDNIFGLGVLLAVTALYVFPDGRLPARPLIVAYAAGFTALVVVARFLPSAIASDAESLGLGLIVAGGLGSMIDRAVRGDALIRRQVGLPIFALLTGLLSGLALGSILPETPWLGVMVSLVITIGFPVSLLVSVMRYRLYEIDRLVSRTISYALLVAILGLLFGLVAVWIPQALGLDDPIFVAGATLVAAALFNPVRRRLQQWVDRRFNRARYDSAKVVEAFSMTLRDRIDPDDLVSGWVGVVSQTMEPSSMAVWVKGS